LTISGHHFAVFFYVPQSQTAFGSRTVSTTGRPQAWNQPPADIRNAARYSTFKHNLKTFLFNGL